MSALCRLLPRIAPLLALALAGCVNAAKSDDEGAPPRASTSEKIRSSLARMNLTASTTPDGFAVRLDVRPLDSLGAPGSRCLIVATVTDAEGQPRRQKKMEWTLDGVGEITAVDTASYLSVLEQKPQPRFAVSYTAALPHTIKGEAGEDVYIQPGQTWCILTSEVEGDARLSVHAPEIANANARDAYVIRRWADVSWIVPPVITTRLGEQPVLATQVIRASDRQPTGNYRVHYRILDGPDALFAINRLTESEVAAINGSARVALYEPQSRPGSNRVLVELVRTNSTTADAQPEVIARSQTTVVWEAPEAALSIAAPPSAVVGEEVPINLTVNNSGRIATSSVAVRMPAPEGSLFLRSDPPAQDDGGQLRWNLPAIPGGSSTTIRAVFKAPSPAVVQFAASAQGEDGLFVQKRATTRVALAELLVNLQAPPSAAPNDTVTYEATVTNNGSGPVRKVVLSVLYDEGLEHASQAHPLELPIGPLDPGKSRTLPIAFVPRENGTFRVRATASAEGNLHGEALHTISIAGKVLAVNVSGPATRYVDRPGTWDVRVGNPGTVPLTNVIVRLQMPPEIQCRSASDKGQYSAQQAVWTVGTLLPNEQKTYQVTAAAMSLTAKSEVTATATADGVAEQLSIAPLEVLGSPAVRVEIASPTATAPLKNKIVYRIVVRNDGSLAARNVQVGVELTPNVLRPRAATGPTIGRVAGDRVTFDPLDRLEAKQSATFLVEVEAGQLGDGRIKVSVKSDVSAQPVQIEEATQVIPAPPEKVQGNQGNQVTRPQ